MIKKKLKKKRAPKKRALKKKPSGRASRSWRMERERDELREENERLERENKRLKREGNRSNAQAVHDHEEARKKRAGDNAHNDDECPYCGSTWFDDFWHNYCGAGDRQPGTRTCRSCGCCWRLER